MTPAEVATIQTDAVRKAFGHAQFDKMPKEQREAYEKEDVQYSRISEAMEEKRQEGRAKGLAEGEAKGKAEGLAEGKAEGLAEGKAEGLAEGDNKERRKVALKMLSKGKPDNEILEFSGLTADELAELKKSSNA